MVKLGPARSTKSMPLFLAGLYILPDSFSIDDPAFPGESHYAAGIYPFCSSKSLLPL
jgi:hypothetical protein